MATEPSESEPTFTPPGSVAPLQELPEDIIIRSDPAEPEREAWADQQDQPIEVEVETADLLGIDEQAGVGAAVGAPVVAEPVVEGPVNYNVFHGEGSPPRVIETKTEQYPDLSGAASSAPRSSQRPKKEEAVGAADSLEGAPAVESIDPEFEVDYDDPDAEEEEEPLEAPEEGAALGAPEGDGEGPFQPVRRRGARGSKSGHYIQKKAFVKRFHQEGFPALLEWTKSFIREHCGGRAFEVRKPYLPSANEISIETCTPLLRLVADFNKEDADNDPLLTIARLENYIPALRTFLTNRSAALQQEVYQLVRELRVDHREGIPGPNPLEFYEDPLMVQGAPERPPWEGLGVQYQRRRRAQEQEQGQEPEAPTPSQSEAPSEQPEETAAASSAAPAKGQTASGWRPTLQARRIPQEPEGPPPARARLIPRPPEDPPAAHQLTVPPYPAPDRRPEEFILPRDRQVPPQHPSGPPRSARLEQARSKPSADRSRGRATERRQDPQQPAVQESRSRRRP